MAIVAIENLCKVYQLGLLELRVLRDLDLSIEQGKTLIIVTHDDGIAAKAGRVVQLFDGQIERQEYKQYNKS